MAIKTRDELVKDIEKYLLVKYPSHWTEASVDQISLDMVDFIIADRKRVVEPLVKANKESDEIGNKESVSIAWQRLDKAVY